MIIHFRILQYLDHMVCVEFDILVSTTPSQFDNTCHTHKRLLVYRKTKWEFLEGVQKKGIAPPRSTLVNQCMTDMAILDALCESVSSNLF